MANYGIYLFLQLENEFWIRGAGITKKIMGMELGGRIGEK